MLDNVVGQSSIKRYLSNVMIQSEFSAGYILEGPKFMGKEFIAEQIGLARTKPLYIDKIVPTQDRKLVNVDDIRDMIQQCHVKTYGNQIRVFIVPNAEKMNASCQNAFLKTLEEPPLDSMFILLTTDSQYLLETIRSRCTTLKMAPYSKSDIWKYLTEKGLQVDDALFALTDGCLNKYEFMTEKAYLEMKELVFKIFSNITDMHRSRIFSIVKHIEKADDLLDDMLSMFALVYKDLYLIKMGLDSSTTLNLPAEIRQLADKWSIDVIGQQINFLDRWKSRLYLNCNVNMLASNFLIKMREGV